MLILILCKYKDLNQVCKSRKHPVKETKHAPSSGKHGGSVVRKTTEARGVKCALAIFKGILFSIGHHRLGTDDGEPIKMSYLNG